MKVLVVEDDENMASFLAAHLPTRGFVVDVVRTGMQAIRAGKENEYDLILLDLHLPDMAGDTVLDSLRNSIELPPVLMVTVNSDSAAKVRILNAGADDYVVKPFQFEELVARMRALLRRAEKVTPMVLSTEDLVLNVQAQTAYRQDIRLLLTRKEFALLEYLLRYQGRVVSKAALIEHAWESTSTALTGVVDTHMTNLRKKVGEPELIQTVHGRGYLIA